jgi:hypothetical protein
MKWTYGIAAASVVAMMGTTVLASCEGDESAPSRPRTQSVLEPDQKAKDDAFNRETETPKRALPTSGAEFPGQSNATPVTPAPGEPTVITADAGNMNPLPYGSFRTPESDYNTDLYQKGAPVPHLPLNPGTTPAIGTTAVPNIGLTIDHSWGEVLPLENYHHRDWPDMQTTYVPAIVKHNPVYYFNIQDHTSLPLQNTYVGGWQSNALEVPWFFVNTLALPVLMVLEPPFAQRTTQQLGNDPIYFNYLPKGGPIIPSPTPGIIKWEYPFLKASEENENSEQISTQPATIETPDLPPVAPTLNTPASTAPTR